jgi:DNA-binding NarL/FixJ family response regulator
VSRTSVLLADDHVMLLDVLVHILREDFNVLGTAHDGRSVIEMAKQKRPDVIVMDIAMPSLNGIDATTPKGALSRQNSVSFDARRSSAG